MGARLQNMLNMLNMLLASAFLAGISAEKPEFRRKETELGGKKTELGGNGMRGNLVFAVFSPKPAQPNQHLSCRVPKTI